jgi:phage host-nuclease inhibitor protein Gam
MAKREKKVVHTGVTREEMEAAFGEYALADAKKAKINADIDVATTKLREKRADEISQLDDVMEKAFDVMQAFAVENKDELFAKKKSMESVHGVIGFRTGTPTVKATKGFTFAKSLIEMREYMPSYIRTKEEVNKERLIADRDDEEIAKLIKRVGLTITQDETFYVEPKKEAV